MEEEFGKSRLPEDLRQLHARLERCISEAADTLLPAPGSARDAALLRQEDRVGSLIMICIHRELLAVPEELRQRYLSANPAMGEMLAVAGLGWSQEGIEGS